MTRDEAVPAADVSVQSHETFARGSVTFFRPLSEAGRSWLEANAVVGLTEWDEHLGLVVWDGPEVLRLLSTGLAAAGLRVEVQSHGVGNDTLCDLVRYPHGIDLRAFADGELYRTQLCRDLDEWSRVQAEWRATLEADGWVTAKEGSGSDGDRRSRRARESR